MLPEKQNHVVLDEILKQIEESKETGCPLDVDEYTIEGLVKALKIALPYIEESGEDDHPLTLDDCSCPYCEALPGIFAELTGRPREEFRSAVGEDYLH